MFFSSPHGMHCWLFSIVWSAAALHPNWPNLCHICFICTVLCPTVALLHCCPVTRSHGTQRCWGPPRWRILPRGSFSRTQCLGHSAESWWVREILDVSLTHLTPTESVPSSLCQWSLHGNALSCINISWSWRLPPSPSLYSSLFSPLSVPMTVIMSVYCVHVSVGLCWCLCLGWQRCDMKWPEWWPLAEGCSHRTWARRPAHIWSHNLLLVSRAWRKYL